ncbi:MAG: hypothetical protein QOJ35_3523 [Solirubrobacteraceae bacterium]|nr:hypothetical protein [Solirubrobacteraceae bacterium]
MTDAGATPVLTTTGPSAKTDHFPEAVAFTRDGKRLATASSGDDKVSLFSVSAGGVLTHTSTFQITGTNGLYDPKGLAFNPDGTLLAAANTEADTVSVLSVSPDGVLTEVGPHGGTTTGYAPISVAFSPDGTQLATADQNQDEVSVFSVTPGGVLGDVVNSDVPGRPWSVAFSPIKSATGDTLIATVSRGNPGLGDGNLVSVFKVSPSGVLGPRVGIAGTDAGPEGVAFSPDGKLVATANFDGDSVSVFSVAPSGALSEVGPHLGTTTGDQPESVAFSPDGKLLATANRNGNSVSVFSVSEGGVLTRSGPAGLWPHTGGAPHSVAFGPRTTTPAADRASTPGGMLATADAADDAVSTFFVSTRGRLTPVGSPSPTGGGPDAVAFSPPDGKLLATANDAGGSVSVFSVLAGGVLASVGPAIQTDLGPHSLAFSRDGGLLATANFNGRSVRVFSVLAGGALADFASATDQKNPQSVAFSPVADLLASANYNGPSVSVFDVSTPGVLPLVGSATTGRHPTAVAFSPDGGLLATANQGANSVSMFTVTDGALTEVPGSPYAVGSGEESVAFSPDGKRLAVANTTIDSVTVFTLTADGQLSDPRSGTTDPAPAWVAWGPLRPDGTMLLATANRDGNTTSLFLVTPSGSLAPVGEPTPADNPRKVAFSPDGTLLATDNRGASNTVSVYPLAAPALDTAIAAGPPPVTAAPTATFVLDANYPSTFECRLDDGAYQACTTPFTTPPLAEGTHTFEVRTTDLLGHVAAETASRMWRIDQTAPTVNLLAPVAGAPNLANPVTFSWEPTTDTMPPIKRYELWIDGVLSVQVEPLSCIVNVKCTATPPVALTHGAHTWEVHTIDDLDNSASTVPPRPFTVDAAPPSQFALTAPEDGAATTTRRPTMSWQASDDGGGSGLAGYDVLIDDHVAATNVAATSFTPSSDLAEGTHGWRVVAYDNNGNPRAATERHFTIDVTPPVAALTAAPNPVLVGRTVTFDGAGSSDPGTAVVRYEWDLDGNGSFELDTGATASTSKAFAQAGAIAVLLRVTDRVGLTGVARIDLHVNAETPPPPPPSVSINDGDLYTNTPRVTIKTTSPSGATQMAISNDGGFKTARHYPLQSSTPWTLESTGAERLPKTVYVRFARGSTAIATLTDDIILDEIPPVVVSARMTLPKGEGGPPLLQVRARDRGLSGVSKVQVTNDRRHPNAAFRANRAMITLNRQRGERRLNPRRAVYVRVRDRAGNLSSWRTVTRIRAGRR